MVDDLISSLGNFKHNKRYYRKNYVKDKRVWGKKGFSKLQMTYKQVT